MLLFHGGIFMFSLQTESELQRNAVQHFQKPAVLGNKYFLGLKGSTEILHVATISNSFPYCSTIHRLLGGWL